MIGVGHFETTPKMRELINEVLDSGRISYGPKCQEFERRFATIHGNRYGVLSNSGTSSLQVALQAMKEMYGWKDGDEVIVPSVTFVATINIVLHNNMKPVLVDVDPYTYNINWRLAVDAVTDKTRAIIPVHLFGRPADVAQIVANISPQIRIIVDSCESAGSDVLTQFSDITCFSTYMAHIVTTGVGGIATTDHPDYATKMRSLVNHGRDGIYISYGEERNMEVMQRRFRFPSIGHSFRITELEAALGLAQLDYLNDNIGTRHANACYISDGLKPLAERGLLQLPAPGWSANMMYPIVCLTEDKWGLCNHLELNGIETREMLPLTNQPAYNFDEDAYPVAKVINESGFYIACHPGLSRADLEKMVQVIEDYF